MRRWTSPTPSPSPSPGRADIARLQIGAEALQSHGLLLGTNRVEKRMVEEATMLEEIPYEEIDCEIRQLVRLMNSFPGIRTGSSCVGHELDAETQVTFSAESQEAVVGLLSALPLFGYRAGFINNHAFWRVVWLTASLSSEGTLDFTLRIGGFPRYVQRETLDEVERSLGMATESTS